MAKSLDRLKSLQSDYSSFYMEGAAIIVDTGDEFITITNAPDVYDGLYEIIEGGDKFPTARGIAVVTTGWAAPLNANGEVEGAPSEHPEKRKVRLTAYVSCEGMVSSVSFEGEDEPVYDEGQAHGSLAEALFDAWKAISR